MYNPSLRRESRNEPASVIPVLQEDSLLEWLKASGRLKPRENQESEEPLLEGEDGDEMDELIDTDDPFDDMEDEDELESDLDTVIDE